MSNPALVTLPESIVNLKSLDQILLRNAAKSNAQSHDTCLDEAGCAILEQWMAAGPYPNSFDYQWD